MSTVFTKIINGDLPGHFVWQDETAVAFLSIGPLTDGHVLVVPRAEIDQWTDAPAELLSHLMSVAQTIGKAQLEAFGSARVGLMVAGFEVPHLHVHVWPTESLGDFNLAHAQHNPDPAVLAANAGKIREALRAAGHGEHAAG